MLIFSPKSQSQILNYQILNICRGLWYDRMQQLFLSVVQDNQNVKFQLVVETSVNCYIQVLAPKKIFMRLSIHMPPYNVPLAIGREDETRRNLTRSDFSER